MRLFLIALAFLALPLTSAAQDGAASIEALRDGDMKKLVVHPAPKPASSKAFSDLDGGSHTLADFTGKIVLLNFWATWCAPCREEMPALDRLQAQLGGDDFAIVTLATGRNSPQGIRRFFEDAGIRNLPMFTDANQAIARDMAVLGLPITVILDRQGQEIARLRGDAAWDSESAQAILLTLIDAGV